MSGMMIGHARCVSQSTAGRWRFESVRRPVPRGGDHGASPPKRRP